jgi:hypothetical protein
MSEGDGRARVALMQPYLFPYLGYFALFDAVDHFVSFDTAQYIRRGWVNRNRILHPTQGWQYFQVPVRHVAQQTPIVSVPIAREEPWKRRIIGQLSHYRALSERFAEVRDLVDHLLWEGAETIAELNHHSLKLMAAHLGLRWDGLCLSTLSVNAELVEVPGDWGREATRVLGGHTYVNPPGGESLYEAGRFQDAGLALQILRMDPDIRYSQGGRPFESWLSIIDVLMFQSPVEALALLRRRSLELR